MGSALPVQCLRCSKLVSTTKLYSRDVTVRSGQQCAQLLHQTLCVNSFARACMYIYNSFDVDEVLTETMEEVVSLL